MQSGTAPTVLRRSSRVPTAVQVLVTSLEGKHFSDVCETLVVNAHGCAILTRVKLDAGVPLHLHSTDGRETTARVVDCQPLGPDQQSWRMGAKLDQPENFWGLKDCPKDWALAPVPPRHLKTNAHAATPASSQSTSQSAVADVLADRLARQLEAQMKRMILESVRPLQAEIVALREKMSRRDANPNRFEVSLGSIPPELEQQLEGRLRKDLGPKVLDEARQQSAQVLASAKTMIDQQTSEAHQNFLRGVSQELKVVQNRAHEISAQISQNTEDHLRRGLEDFRQKLLDGGNSLKRLSAELLEFLQQELNAEHDARRGDLEQLRAAVSAESMRLQQEVEYLDTRIAKLDDSAQSLESGLDQRLSRLSSDTIKDTRTQFESTASQILEELTARSLQVLSDQLEETTGKMKAMQETISNSTSQSLKTQAAHALQAFEDSMEQLASLSVERWRLKLESGLIAMTKGLNEQFRMETGTSEDRK